MMPMGKIERRLFLRGMTAGVAGGLTALVHQALAADPKSLRQGIHRINGEVSVNGKPAREGTHHEKPVWIENGVTMPASVVNHTDAEIIMLEALVGRGSPFPAGGSRY